MTSTVTYLGALRTTSTHTASEKTMITDAPLDNHGKGAAFSPTDTVATALASCMITIMGIKARNLEIDLTETTAAVTKIMGVNPRRIVEIQVNLHFPKSFDPKTQTPQANNIAVLQIVNKISVIKQGFFPPTKIVFLN